MDASVHGQVRLLFGRPQPDWCHFQEQSETGATDVGLPVLLGPRRNRGNSDKPASNVRETTIVRAEGRFGRNGLNCEPGSARRETI